MKSQSVILVFTTLAVTSLLCLAEVDVYKIVDETGRVTYTDTPPADKTADQLELPHINQLPNPQVENTDTVLPEIPDFAGYSAVDIVAPINDSVIHYDQQNMVVQMVLAPELQPGHRVQFYLDGAPYGRPVIATSYAMGELERGSHSVSARVVTAEGATVANSRSVNVHVQRHFKRKN
mgnify:CR=1 FL=1